MGRYSFYFPKRFYKRYEGLGQDFTRMCNEEVDCRTSVCIYGELRDVWRLVLNKLSSVKLELYCADEKGVYMSLKPRSKWVVSRVFTTHLIFKYVLDLKEVFDKLNRLYEKGVIVWTGKVEERLFVAKPYKTKDVKVVFNVEALGILDSINEYFRIIDRSLLFSWMLCKWVVDNKDIYAWLKEGHVAKCYTAYHLHLDPLVREVVSRVEEVVEKSGVVEGVNSIDLLVYEVFRKYEVVDVNMPTIEMCQMIIANGYDLDAFRDAVYSLWKKGLIEAIPDGSYTFNSKGIKMPRRFRLKE